jgi:heptosyltransferase-2
MKRILVKLDYWIKNSSLSLLKGLLFRNTKNFTKGNILIFRTGSIGDSICALPAIFSIRKKYPDSKISILTNPAGKNISMDYLLDPTLDITIVNYLGLGFIGLLKLLKKGNYDLFIELPQTHSTWKTNVRNLFTARLIGASFGFGWQVYASSLFKQYQQTNNHFLPETERLLKILQNEGIESNHKIFPLAISNENKTTVYNLLDQYQLLHPSKNIAIVAGAKRTTNRWPIDRFANVISQLSKEGYNLLLIGGKDDISTIKPLQNIPNVYDFVGKLTPIESGVLMQYCGLVISNDTGPLHLAYAVGTPIVGIYSARDYPIHWYPPRTSLNKILRMDDVKCSVCLLDECPNNLVCMKGISSGEVLEAAHDLLAIHPIKPYN